MRALSGLSLMVAGTVTCITSACSVSGAGGVAAVPALRSASTGEGGSWMDPAVRATQKQLLYVADLNEQNVLVYEQAGRHQQPVGQIKSGISIAYSLFVDTTRNLWVGNWTGYGGQVLRYRQGSKRPDLTLPGIYSGWPVALWVARDSTVYALYNLYAGAPVILKYPKGRQAYQPIMTDPNISLLTAIVGDAKGDIYAGGIPAVSRSVDGEIDVLPSGKSNWQNTGMIVNAPDALALDAKGNMLVSGADAVSNAFLTYRIGSKHASNRINCVYAGCGPVAFDNTGTHLWGVEAADSAGKVFEFDYPSGKRLDVVTGPGSGLGPSGVAASPALSP